MPDDGQTMHNAPHNAAVTADVNAPVYEELFSDDGRSIMVQREDADHWLRQGFSRVRFDLDEEQKALQADIKELPKAIKEYLDGVQQDGMIDTADGAAAVTVRYILDRIADRFGRIQENIARTYAVRQGDPVLMVDEDGREVQVDPGQVDEYKKAHGLRVAKDRG